MPPVPMNTFPRSASSSITRINSLEAPLANCISGTYITLARFLSPRLPTPVIRSTSLIAWHPPEGWWTILSIAQTSTCRSSFTESCYAVHFMELSLEAYRNIVKYVGNRSDIATLCRVSKGFQYPAERALYNTLYLRGPLSTISVCDVLASQPRLAALVDALTIYLDEENEESDDEGGEGQIEEDPLPPGYWSSISRALQAASHLHHLNLHISNATDKSAAWILTDCTFQLRSFHCDLEWDHDLVTFLNTQLDLDDLYLLDYNDGMPGSGTATPRDGLATPALPNLHTLECTFSEAAVALVPGRPVTHLKTCFSRTEVTEKRAEKTRLFSKIRQASGRLRSLDIADSNYTEQFSLELLRSVVHARATTAELGYLGTLVLPIGGSDRLQFYALLMRLPRINCIEVEVSDWEPPPSTPSAFRALAGELRLYCRTVTRVVFVVEFERTVVSVVGGICTVDNDTGTDILWREV